MPMLYFFASAQSEHPDSHSLLPVGCFCDDGDDGFCRLHDHLSVLSTSRPSSEQAGFSKHAAWLTASCAAAS